jgi:SAM-dependent methyltransferase
MLSVAHNKAKRKELDLTFVKGDMRTSTLGVFDAVLTIFNAIGHLTKNDFEKAMQNVYYNLKTGGIYIFDIFNLEYFLEDDNITKLTIDWMEVKDNKKLREIQYSTVNDEGVLASYTTSFECEFSGKTTKTHEGSQTLQIYSADQLKDMLERNGFDLILQRGLESQHFSKTKTERILTVARKI